MGKEPNESVGVMEEIVVCIPTHCQREGCRFKAKFNVEGNHFCGYHKKPAGALRAKRASKAMVLPRCSGLTTRTGRRCKRNGTKICGEHVYCCSHIPDDYSNRAKLQEDCPICFASLSSKMNIVSTHCGHLFHKDCIETWRNTCPQGDSCPVCRRKTNISRKRPAKVQRIYTTIEMY